MQTDVALTGIVLAAGAGRRMGRPKAELEVGGVRLLDSAVRLLTAAGCDEVVAVVRSAGVRAAGARSLVNPEPDQGMGSSLRIGMSEAAGQACVVILVDQVGISTADVDAVIEGWTAGHQIVVARRAGHRSHPVLIGRPWFDDFAAAASGDQGGRAFIDQHPELVYFVDLPDQLTDLDTPADLQQLS
jgi:CTP:molybdopterin cytidylyltransferase MocA